MDFRLWPQFQSNVIRIWPSSRRPTLKTAWPSREKSKLRAGAAVVELPRSRWESAGRSDRGWMGGSPADGIIPQRQPVNPPPDHLLPAGWKLANVSFRPWTAENYFAICRTWGRTVTLSAQLLQNSLHGLCCDIFYTLIFLSFHLLSNPCIVRAIHRSLQTWQGDIATDSRLQHVVGVKF